MVQFSSCDSPFGPIQIGCEDGCVVSVRYIDTDVSELSSPLFDLAKGQLLEYFCGKRSVFDFPINPKGTPFQLAVWHELRKIPYGETRTYGEIAASIGKPKATRAVGMACNRNPLWIVIPCHRVVGRNHNLTGYAGGLSMKQALLELEHQP